MSTPTARRCAVLGDPIEHSLSPVLHRAGYAAAGLDWQYDALRVPAGGLASFLEGLDPSWRGLSLTMPLKREAMQLVDRVSASAELAGAANTIVVDEGQLVGANTDVAGAAAALHERYGRRVRAATVLGGGATAAAVSLALCDLGAESVRLLVRSPDRAATTEAVISRHPGRPAVTVASLDEPVTGEVVVSTIPAFAQTEALVARCAHVPVVFEVLYDPWPTPLAASATGRTLVGGLDLLVHQAALQFELFTGGPAPLAAMRAAGEAALAARRTTA